VFPQKSAFLSLAIFCSAFVNCPVLANSHQSTESNAQSTAATKQNYIGVFNASCLYDGENLIVNWTASAYSALVSVVSGTITTSLGETQYLGGLPSGLHVSGLSRAADQHTFYVGPDFLPSLAFVVFENGRMLTIGPDAAEGILPDAILDCQYLPNP